MAKKHGGYTIQNYYGADISRAQKRALIAIPVPNPEPEPELKTVQSIDEVLDRIGAEFRVKLRHLNGSSQTETMLWSTPPFI